MVSPEPLFPQGRGEVWKRPVVRVTGFFGSRIVLDCATYGEEVDVTGLQQTTCGRLAIWEVCIHENVTKCVTVTSYITTALLSGAVQSQAAWSPEATESCLGSGGALRPPTYGPKLTAPGRDRLTANPKATRSHPAGRGVQGHCCLAAHLICSVVSSGAPPRWVRVAHHTEPGRIRRRGTSTPLACRQAMARRAPASRGAAVRGPTLGAVRALS